MHISTATGVMGGRLLNLRNREVYAALLEYVLPRQGDRLMSLNAERLAEFISDIERARERLRPLGAMPLEEFMASEDSQDIARSRPLVAIQAALGICYHICAQETSHVPRDYADCFRTLGKAGIRWASRCRHEYVILVDLPPVKQRPRCP